MKVLIHFPNFNGTTVEIWEWITNLMPHFTTNVITCPCPCFSKRGRWNLWKQEPDLEMSGTDLNKWYGVNLVMSTRTKCLIESRACTGKHEYNPISCHRDWPSQKRKGLPSGSPDRQGTLKRVSTSPVTTRAVILTTYPSQWFYHGIDYTLSMKHRGAITHSFEVGGRRLMHILNFYHLFITSNDFSESHLNFNTGIHLRLRKSWHIYCM